MQYRPDIDGLRAIAVLAVVFYHAGVAGFSGGFVGVDVFFVISGYLITKIIHDEIQKQQFSILLFYERRARRILPALFVVLIASLLVGWAMLVPQDYEQLAWSAASALAFISNIWFWQNSGGYFDGATDYLPLLHTWSLAVEEQFYIVFPLLLLVIVRFGLSVKLGLTMSIVIGSFVMSVWLTPLRQSASFYLLPTRIWELGVGSMLALWPISFVLSRWVREILAAGGLFAIIVSVSFYNSAILFPGLAALPPVLGTAAVILAGGHGSSLSGSFLSWRPLVLIGLMSYSLYLWHWPVMSFARNRLFIVDLPFLWQVLTTLLSFLLAWASLRFVERPFRSGQTPKIMARNIFRLAGLGAFSIAGIIALVVVTGGAEWRYTPEEVAALSGLEPSREVRACRGIHEPDELCIFGDDTSTESAKWILLGDSHAEAILPAVDELAKARGKVLAYASQPACAPLPGVERLDLTNKMVEACSRFLEHMVPHIIDSSAYDTVILHARWSLYVKGTRHGLNHENNVTLVAQGFSAPSIATEDGNVAIVDRALTELITQFKGAGIHVFLIGSVPEVPWDVAERMRAKVLYDVAFPKAPSVKLIESWQGPSEELLAEITLRTGAVFVSLTQNICGATCPGHDGLTAFYRDTNHLSLAGARQLILPILQASQL